MMTIITGWLINYGLMTAGGTIGIFLLGWILKKIPTGKWAKTLGTVGEKHGLLFSQFCQKKIPFWNSVIEPVFIDTLAVIPSYLAGFIVGLKRDNKE
jgi:hypothetical protein